MFNPRKTDTNYSSTGSHFGESAPNASSTPAGAASAAPAAAAYKAPRPSIATPDLTQSSNHSIVDECLTMRGDLESDGDILVKGKVIGNIKCNVLIIDIDAYVEGGIEAETVIVRGKSKGVIKAERVRLEHSADIDCEIYQKSFSAEEGANIRGSLKSLDESDRPISRNDTKKPTAKIEPKEIKDTKAPATSEEVELVA